MSTEGKLDRKRSYGTVYNDPNIGFVQDEKYYRHDGYLYMPSDPLLGTLRISDKGLEGPGVSDVASTPLTNAIAEKLDSALAERSRNAKRT